MVNTQFSSLSSYHTCRLKNWEFYIVGFILWVVIKFVSTIKLTQTLPPERGNLETTALIGWRLTDNQPRIWTNT
ncbi:hypothetical protein [Lyngbya aestuarii]|uniref:hypothetical protein n=1 Tax=Lyngbya aestuarii TaxID=118322 RepID=UPI00403E1E98